MHYFRDYKPLLAGWLLFIAGIVIAAYVNDGVGLYTVVKYLVFLLVLVGLVLITPLSAAFLEKSLCVALFISLAPLIFLILFGQLDTIVILGDGRMGWIASLPGVIWKVGACVWPFAVWHCLKRFSFGNGMLALSAVVIMALDGSRTAMLWLVLVWFVLTVIAIATHVNRKPLRVSAGLLLAILLSFCVIQPMLLNRAVDHNVQATSEFKAWVIEQGHRHENRQGREDVSAISPGEDGQGEIRTTAKRFTSTRLINGENGVRLEMLRVGWQQAVNKFPWGGGFGSTRVMDLGVRNNIHMTYLQLLADEGVLAFVGYLIFILFPVYRGLGYIAAKREGFVERFEQLLCPLSVIVLMLFIGCFHPLSNELTEWGVVLTAIALVITHVPHRH